MDTDEIKLKVTEFISCKAANFTQWATTSFSQTEPGDLYVDRDLLRQNWSWKRKVLSKRRCRCVRAQGGTTHKSTGWHNTQNAQGATTHKSTGCNNTQKAQGATTHKKHRCHNTQEHTINTHCRGSPKTLCLTSLNVTCAPVRATSQFPHEKASLPSDQHLSLTRSHRKARPAASKPFHLYVTRNFNVNLSNV